MVADPLTTRNDEWLDKFVGLALGVALGDGSGDISRRLTGAGDERFVGDLDAFPAVIAVHRVVAAHDRSNFAHADLGDLLLDLLDVDRGTGGRRIAAVGDQVEIYLGHALLFGEAHERIEVIIHRVDATLTDEAQEVEGAPLGFDMFHGAQERFILEEAARGDRHVDAG